MKTKKMGIGIGTLSMMMMFVVLCLTIFAVLALITVDRDVKLTQKTLQSLTDFYEADGEAESILAQIDEALVEARDEMKDKVGWDEWPQEKKEEIYQEIVGEKLSQLSIDLELYKKDENWQVRYTVPMGEKQALFVELQVQFYEHSYKSRYQILEWVLKTNEGWEYDTYEPSFKDIIIK